MPTYEYQCFDCGEKVEYFQSMQESPITECPTCHGKLGRLVSGGTGLIFKGSGFYINDYKKSNNSLTPLTNGKITTSEIKSDSKPGEQKSTETKTVTTEN